MRRLSWKRREAADRAIRETRREVVVQVRCCGAMHRIVRTAGGQLVLANHDAATDAALALAGIEDCRCHAILAAWRVEVQIAGHKCGAVLPKPLRDAALVESRRRLKRQTEARELQNIESVRRTRIYYCDEPTVRARMTDALAYRVIRYLDTRPHIGRRETAYIRRDWMHGRMTTSQVSLVCVARAVRARRFDVLALDHMGCALVLQNGAWTLVTEVKS